MIRESDFKEQEKELESTLNLNILERLDHIILVMEDYLNSNREIVEKLDMVGRDSTKQIEVKNNNIIESLDYFTSVMENYSNSNKEIVKRLG